MNLKSFVAAGLVAAMLALSASAALAQNASSAAPAPAAAGATPAPAAQNWLKICQPIANGQRVCVMRQVVVTSNNQFLGSFLLRDDPSLPERFFAVAAVPLGMLLPFGVTWQVDAAKSIRVPYYLCDPTSCATQLVVNQGFVDSLRKGGKLTLVAKNRQSQDLSITINLTGFAQVYDGDAALTYDEFNKNASGQVALEKILADRAEAARTKLESSSAPQ